MKLTHVLVYVCGLVAILIATAWQQKRAVEAAEQRGVERGIMVCVDRASANEIKLARQLASMRADNATLKSCADNWYEIAEEKHRQYRTAVRIIEWQTDIILRLVRAAQDAPELLPAPHEDFSILNMAAKAVIVK